MASQELIRSAIATYFGAICAMDANAFAETFASDGVSNDLVGTPTHEGRAAIRQFVEEISAATDRVALTPNKSLLRVTEQLRSGPVGALASKMQLRYAGRQSGR